MTEFLLVRHGANEYTRTHRLAGWTPEVHLNEFGTMQAAAVGERLRNHKIHAIYSSPLERTIETAQAILAHHPHLQLQTIAEVGEVQYGEWTGQELGKLAQTRLWRHVQHAPSRVTFPGGEAMRDAQMRAVNALEGLRLRHPRDTVCVVSHSDIIKMIVAHYMGMHLDLFQRINISPCSLTVIHLGSGQPMIEQVNETGFLPKEPPKKAEEKK
jgi:probable phosphomutase (TIGR03848 family)